MYSIAHLGYLAGQFLMGYYPSSSKLSSHLSIAKIQTEDFFFYKANLNFHLYLSSS